MNYGVREWDEAVDALRSAERALLVCHVNPDGDALGALLGAGLGLRKLGAAVEATWDAPVVELPFAYRFLPGAELLRAPALVSPAPLFVALDCGARDRLGSLAGVAAGAERVVNIDHHPGNDLFGTINVVAPAASSTSELVVRLLAAAGVELDRDIATCLYTGVVTDTGRFSYSNATPETLRLAADLLAFGVPAPEIAREVFDSSPFGYLKLLGRVLDRARLHEPERFVYSWITLADLAETGVAPEETEKLVDVVRGTRAADVAAILKEQSDGTYRVSLRSKGGPSVGRIARRNGGGGHELAAGFTAPGVDAAVAAILEDLR